MSKRSVEVASEVHSHCFMRRAASVTMLNMLRSQTLHQTANRQQQRAVKCYFFPVSLRSRQSSRSCTSHTRLTWSAAAAPAAGRERSVRAKVDNAAAAADAQDLLESLYESQPPVAAAAETQQQSAHAVATADDLLDALYTDSPNKGLAATPPQSVEAAAAPAAAAGAAAPEDVLGALYAADEAAEAPVAGAPSHPSAAVAVASAAADGKASKPAAAAAAADRPPSSPTSSGGGGVSSSRAPPTYVSAPDIPQDLNVFSNAVLLVDKPKGWTSFDACNAIKKAMQKLGVKKVGHAGTLDPAATGLLIICTGAGTKSIDGFMAAHKEYSGTLKLGEGTPTLDAEVEVNERLPWEHVTDEQLEEAAKKLTGDIEQVPPMFSALHHEGKRLHELARAGVTVERPSRPVTITRFDVHRDPNDRQLVHFYVGCSKGTYIRTLGHDLATSLGTTGHLVALRREAIGSARVDDAWEVDTLTDNLFAAIREQRPEAFNRDNSNRGNRARRARGGGRQGGKQQQGQQQPAADHAADQQEQDGVQG